MTLFVALSPSVTGGGDFKLPKKTLIYILFYSFIYECVFKFAREVIIGDKYGKTNGDTSLIAL